MRFFYKRQPSDELELEIDDVQQAMCSGSLVMFDLFFYSFFFALLLMPIKASLLHFGGLFLFVYVLFASIFLIVRKVMDKKQDCNDIKS